MLLNLPSFPGHCHRVPVGSGEASHLGNGSFNSFPCDLDVAQCYQLLGLSSGLTKSRHLGRAAVEHGCTSASGVCRLNQLELRGWCLCHVHSGRVASDQLLLGPLGSMSLTSWMHLPIQSCQKENEFAAPQHGNSVMSGVISCFPKYASDPNSIFNRGFPYVSLCVSPRRPGSARITQVLEGPSLLLISSSPFECRGTPQKPCS